MRGRQKRLAQATVGAVLLWAVLAKARTTGRVVVGPVTVTPGEKLTFDRSTDAQVQRLTLAITRAKQLLGADPNTLVSRRPTTDEATFVENTLDLGRQLESSTGGKVPYPAALERMLALALRLPGSELQAANASLYQALGVDPSGENEATLPLTAERDRIARSAITKWRPYSADAVDTLFVLLDQSRELAVGTGALS